MDINCNKEQEKREYHKKIGTKWLNVCTRKRKGFTGALNCRV